MALSKALENGLSGKSGDSVSGSLPAGKLIYTSESGKVTLVAKNMSCYKSSNFSIRIGFTIILRLNTHRLKQHIIEIMFFE